MKKEQPTPTDAFNVGAFMGFLSFLVLAVAIVGSIWTQMLLWNWYVAPLGLARIGFFHSLGLTILLSYLRSDIAAFILVKCKPEQRFKIGGIALSITIACLILGWLVHYLV